MQGKFELMDSPSSRSNDNNQIDNDKHIEEELNGSIMEHNKVSSSINDHEDIDLETPNNDKEPMIPSDLFIHSLRTVKKLKNTFYVKMLFIKHGYRAHKNMDACKCAKSAFKLHNETFSVWSHFIPGIYYFVQLFMIMAKAGFYSEIQKT